MCNSQSILLQQGSYLVINLAATLQIVAQLAVCCAPAWASSLQVSDSVVTWMCWEQGALQVTISGQ